MPSRVMIIVARALKAYRTTGNLTQEQAAAVIGCSIPTYRQLEGGASGVGRFADPKLSTLMRALTTLRLDEPMLQALDKAVSSEMENLYTEQSRTRDVGV